MRQAAEKLAAMGPQAVLVKGGHLEGDPIGHPVPSGRMDRIYLAADRNPPHPRHRLHVLGGHHGVAGIRVTIFRKQSGEPNVTSRRRFVTIQDLDPALGRWITTPYFESG